MYWNKMADKTWTDDDREQLAEKLDKDLDEFIAKAAKRRPTAQLGIDELAKELKEHPAFFTEVPANGDLPPLVEALQSLKYSPEENTAEELAQNYKEDGNYNFKLKQIHFAICAYSEGLKQKCNNDQLNAQLYGNRAAAHFELKNYRQALSDCKEALKLKPNHLKVATRAVRCCIHLRLFEDGLALCSDSLVIFPDDKTIPDLRRELEKLKKIDDRDKRKSASTTKRNREQAAGVWAAIKARDVKMEELERREDEAKEEVPDFRLLNCGHPAATDATTVRFADGSAEDLVWPVLFMYPEYAVMDFVPDFHENTRFQDQLDAMFGPTVPEAPWDVKHVYKSDKLKVYFEDTAENSLLRVPNEVTLSQVLTYSEYIVKAGTPTFLILVSNSPFEAEFISKYKSCKVFIFKRQVVKFRHPSHEAS